MPMLNVWRCPVCGAESDAIQGSPPGWVTAGEIGGGGAETFDTWQCVATYAQTKQEEVGE